MKRILVVEDNVGIRTFLDKALRKSGYEVLLAKNGIDGISHLYGDKKIDLILLDIMMPEMDGFNFIEKIKDLDFEGRICMLTSLSDEKNVEYFFSKNVVDYIIKPIEKQELIEKMEIIFSGNTKNRFSTVRSKLIGKINNYDIVISSFSEFNLVFYSLKEFDSKINVNIISSWMSEIIGEEMVSIHIDDKQKEGRLFKYQAHWIALNEENKMCLRKVSISSKDLGYEDYKKDMDNE